MSFVDFHTDMERYMVGRVGDRFGVDQLGASWTEAAGCVTASF